MRRRTGQIAAPGQQLAQHGDLGVVLAGGADARIALGTRLLVGPVRGHAVFGMVVHGLGADLDLDGAAVLVAHHGVQRLVAVGLGARDVVVELGLYGREPFVHP
ncbi:hypothetical protein D3C71_1826820 [compost metagenome]